MVEGVIVVDPQGPAAADQSGGSADAACAVAIGSDVRTRNDPAAGDCRTGRRDAARYSPEPVELSPPRDDARTIIARAAPAGEAASLSGPSELVGAVLVLHDITDLRRADQIRRDFVANVSHELRTPLTAIRGYVEALAEGDASGDEQRRFLEIISRHTLRMERLVRDLLRLARLDAGQETLDQISLDVLQLRRRAWSPICRTAAEARAAATARHRQRRRAESVRADPAQTARRAAEPGGERRQLRA